MLHALVAMRQRPRHLFIAHRKPIWVQKSIRSERWYAASDGRVWGMISGVGADALDEGRDIGDGGI
jgi:hypothetical protein